jgi:predicted nucleotidyltransferase
MYLDRIFGSKTKVNALAALVRNKDRRFMESELADETGSSVSEVSRQIGDLVAVGLVSMEKVGRAKLYAINTQHFLFHPLERLFEDLSKKYREAAGEIAGFAAKRHRAAAVILFGSLAKGKIRSDYVREPSDIDIVVVAEGDAKAVKESLADYIAREISPKYGIISYPIVLSPEDYRKGLDRDRFIMLIHSEGEVIYGRKPRKFG